jgi:hypothetical protein
MRKVCLTLPTNRACAETITAVAGEAVYAAEHFPVEVTLLILDSSDEASRARHARTIAETPLPANVTVQHLDEDAQREFLTSVVQDGTKPDLLLDLLLPAGLSYGACTNRAFLIAAALGCDSVHRRDSDSRYQWIGGTPVYPVHHELTSLGKRAGAAAGGVTEFRLDPADSGKPVVLVGGSFVGELSVDLGEVASQAPDVYYDVVSLWAPRDWPESRKKELVDESFAGARDEVFERDHATLSIVDPMRVDMCNIAFHRVHEQVPLAPATDTIGSDYFLHHLVHLTGLPSVVHNRHIVNFHTAERKTPQGFAAYQLRLAKFFLSMHYLNFIYDRMADAGSSLLDDDFDVRAPLVAKIIRESTVLPKDENAERVDVLVRSYRKLGGKYADVAALVAERGPRLLAKAEQDIADFATLTEEWETLVLRSRAVPLPQVRSAR